MILDTNSRTRDGSKVFSREAGTIAFNQQNVASPLVGGSERIGGVTVDQLQLGADYPNVQSAIDGVINLYQVPVNGVVAYTDQSQTPAGVQMTEELTITGTASDTVALVYGIPVALVIGDNDATITDKVIAVLDKYKANGIAFKSVSKVSGSNNKISVTFLDTNPHPNYFYQNVNLIIQGITTTQAVPGYGSWSFIGTSTITNPGGSGTTTLYHHRRNA